MTLNQLSAGFEDEEEDDGSNESKDIPRLLLDIVLRDWIHVPIVQHYGKNWQYAVLSPVWKLRGIWNASG